jgi:hypothetical protein
MSGDVKRGNQPVYSQETMDWFDTNWCAGVAVDKVVRGMQARGHDDFHAQRAQNLATKRGLYRPPGFHGKPPQASFEETMVQYLLRDRQPLFQDNPVAKPNERYRYPGGFRMGGWR